MIHHRFRHPLHKQLDSDCSLVQEAEAQLKKKYGFRMEGKTVYRNVSPPVLYEAAMKYDRNTTLSSTGALNAYSGEKTGRSPSDKRIVATDEEKQDIWWGSVNIPLSLDSFVKNRQRCIDYLDSREHLFVVDGYAGWDAKYRTKIRIICSRPYHALFMWNMLIRPTEEELKTFGEPDWTILNGGEFPANRYTEGMQSKTSVDLNFHEHEFLILGTQYAGEMKKGVFTIMNYIMPKKGQLSLHSSCNFGENGVSLFFGLSGTGKTTLSADPHRHLIGDDEHVWSEDGVFNIEGGCYAKVINLQKNEEPEIYQAIRFGAVLENTVLDTKTREPDFFDTSVTVNTRVAYPLDFISNSKVPAITGHPNNVILLTCDSFGVLPPVSHLTGNQAMYWFITGYTARVAGTEVGVTEPEATFSPCFGAPFLIWHPMKYAKLLAEKLHQHSANAWLVNTGWSGGPYGVGKRMKLSWTRAIIDAIHNGELVKAETETLPLFDLVMPKSCTGVPSEALNPRNTWADKDKFDKALGNLADNFSDFFQQFVDDVTPDIKAGGPHGRATDPNKPKKFGVIG